MENLIFFGIAGLFAFIGAKKLLFKSYFQFCSILFSVYIGLWSKTLLEGFVTFLPREAAAYKNAIVIFSAAFIVFLILKKVMESLYESEKTFEFPRMLDKLGGMLFGFLTGAVIASFLLLLLFCAPIKTEFKDHIRIPTAEAYCCARMVKICSVVNLLSFQKNNSSVFRQEILKWFEAANPPPPPEEAAPAANQSSDPSESAKNPAKTSSSAGTTEMKNPPKKIKKMP